MVEWVMSNLIDKERSNRAVKKKLKQLGLLSGKPTLKTKWDSSDEYELKELYEQWKGTDDVLETIVNRISTDRSKRNISQKLIAMGLANPEELKKKKQTKSRNKRPDSSGSESSDDDLPQVQPQTKSVMKSKPNKNETIKCLLKVMEEDFKEVLNWLHESLSDTADDQEQDAEEEGVPLVPMTSQELDSMENGEFQSLLRSMGLSEPDGVQESYWRIPGNISPAEIRSMCGLITEALENRLVMPVEQVKAGMSRRVSVESDESSDEDVFSKLKKFMDDKENVPESNVEKPKKQKKQRKSQKSSGLYLTFRTLFTPITSSDNSCRKHFREYFFNRFLCVLGR